MKLPKEIAESIVQDDHDDYAFVEETIINQRRWVTQFSGIFHCISTGKYYRVSYERGSTESQETELFYDEEVEFREVELKEVLVKKWLSIKE